MTLSFYDIILNLKNFENKKIVILLCRKNVEAFSFLLNIYHLREKCWEYNNIIFNYNISLSR